MIFLLLDLENIPQIWIRLENIDTLSYLYKYGSLEFKIQSFNLPLHFPKDNSIELRIKKKKGNKNEMKNFDLRSIQKPLHLGQKRKSHRINERKHIIPLIA